MALGRDYVALYHATGQEVYKNNAIDNEVKLDRNLMLHQGMDHDNYLSGSQQQLQITVKVEIGIVNRGMLGR